MRDLERERERGWERQTDRKRDLERSRERERQTNRHRDLERERERERKRATSGSCVIGTTMSSKSIDTYTIIINAITLTVNKEERYFITFINELYT